MFTHRIVTKVIQLLKDSEKVIKIFDYKFYISRFKDSLFYFGAAIITLPMSLITYPIFAKNLSPYDFSAIGFFQAIMQFFLPFMTLSFYNYYMLDYYRRDESSRMEILRSLVSFLMLFNFFVLLIGYIIVETYLRTSNSLFSGFPLGLIVLLTACFAIGKGFWLIRLRFERESIKYFSISLIFSIFNIGLGLLLVVYGQMGAEGKLLPAFIGELFFFVMFFKLFIKRININSSIIKSAFIYSSPIMISSLMNLPILSFDKILLERINNINEFALYNIAFAFASYVFTFLSAILMTFEPDVYRLVGEKNKKQLIRIFIVLVGIIIILNLIFFVISKPAINLLTAGRYPGAAKYANLIVFSQSMIIIVYFLGSVVSALKLTKVSPIVTIVVSIISVVTLTLFISYFSFYGAIFSQYLTYISWGVFTLLIIRFRNHKLLKQFYAK